MRVCEKLRDACNAACRNGTEALKEKIENLWDEYDVATKLSRGGDPARSRYWEFKARTCESRLWDIVKRRIW